MLRISGESIVRHLFYAHPQFYYLHPNPFHLLHRVMDRLELETIDGDSCWVYHGRSQPFKRLFTDLYSSIKTVTRDNPFLRILSPRVSIIAQLESGKVTHLRFPSISRTAIVFPVKRSIEMNTDPLLFFRSLRR